LAAISLVFLLLGVKDLPASGLTRVDFPETVEVRDGVVRLGDIATVSGEKEGLVRELQELYIGKAPLPGKTRQIKTDSIRVRLKQNGFDVSRILLSGPEKISILRQFNAVSGIEIEDVVRTFIEEKVLEQNPDVKIKEIMAPPGAILSPGRVTFKIKPLDFANLKHKTPVHVHLYVDGEWVKKILVIVELEVVEDVVVARRSLKKGRVITADDIYIRTMDLSGLPSDIIMHEADILGKRVKRGVGALQVMRTNMVEQPLLVRRGDIVQIIAESEKLRITATGMIRGVGGRQGDRVRVVNVDSDRGIYARIVDAKTVIVDHLE